MPVIAVIYAVRPKPGQKEIVRALFARHTATLREAGFITDRETLLLWSPNDQAFIESFEWKSADHARRAESTPSVQEIWSDFAKSGDFVPLASLSETTKPFAHFEPI